MPRPPDAGRPTAGSGTMVSMAAKCTACGNTISTWQELSTLAAGAAKGAWRFVQDNGKSLLALIAQLAAAGGGIGLTAGPMNVNEMPCPHCGAKTRWVDSE
jgi:hypothetical protein